MGEIALLHQPDRRQRSGVDRVTIDPLGNVLISGSDCFICARNMIFQRRYRVDPAVYAKTLVLLDEAALAQAKDRPCTLPKGNAFDHQTMGVRIKKQKENVLYEDSYIFFTSCQSPEIDTAKGTMNAARDMLLNLTATMKQVD